MEKIYKLATIITSSVGSTGSSVLIFVPGMADIEALTELIDGLRVPNVSFICLPIHSDIPFEEQMLAFNPPQQGEVKVIIATNAAESSLTLPDVDHVICLGWVLLADVVYFQIAPFTQFSLCRLCKQIIYNPASHRQMLVPTWISRASATQRAGRTGRVRKGNVYRLYSKNIFQSHMLPFEQVGVFCCSVVLYLCLVTSLKQHYYASGWNGQNSIGSSCLGECNNLESRSVYSIHITHANNQFSTPSKW